MFRIALRRRAALSAPAPPRVVRHQTPAAAAVPRRCCYRLHRRSIGSAVAGTTPFDTHSLVCRLEAQQFTRGQAETISTTLQEVGADWHVVSALYSCPARTWPAA
jgi:hypothetical protein